MKITVYTPTTDNSIYCDEAISSVPHNEYDNIEHIIVHDGCEDFIGNKLALFPYLKIIKGDNLGATAAVKKAVEASTGDFLICLNSDDRMVEGSISAFLHAQSAKPTIKIWTGYTKVFRVDALGNKIVMRDLCDPEIISFNLHNILDDIPLITARFISKDVFDKFGNFSLKYNNCSDREFVLRLFLNKVEEEPLPVYVSELRSHNLSATIKLRHMELPPFMSSHIELANDLLNNCDLSQIDKINIQQWRYREVIRKIIYEFKLGLIDQAVKDSLDLLKSDGISLSSILSVSSAYRLRNRGAGRQ